MYKPTVPAFFQSSTRTTPYLSPADIQHDNPGIKNLDHIPVQITAPAGPSPWQPQTWNKFASFPGSQTVHATKSPLQR